MEEIIGFFPTNQNTLYLLYNCMRQTSNLHSHWVKRSCLFNSLSRFCGQHSISTLVPTIKLMTFSILRHSFHSEQPGELSYFNISIFLLFGLEYKSVTMTELNYFYLDCVRLFVNDIKPSQLSIIHLSIRKYHNTDQTFVSIQGGSE